MTFTEAQFDRMLRQVFASKSTDRVAVSSKAGVDPELGRFIEYFDKDGKTVGIQYEDIGATNVLLGDIEEAFK